MAGRLKVSRRPRGGTRAVVALAALALTACASRPAPALPSRPAAGAAPRVDRSAAPVAAPAGGGSAAAAAPPPSPEDRRPLIVAFGDSLTAGLGVSAREAYPARLEAALNERGYRYRVLNAGISGDTTAGGLARIDMVLEQRPAVLILELGANDGLRGVPLRDTRANLARMIEKCQDAGVKVVLAGMRVPPNYGPDYSRSFQSMFQELADRYRVPLIPFFLEGVGGRPEMNQADGVHPTAAGYRVVTENVLSALVPLLRK